MEKARMRKNLHLLLTALLLLVMFWQSLFWGGAAALPELGPIVRRSAMREAPLVASFIFLGEGLGKVLPRAGYTRCRCCWSLP